MLPGSDCSTTWSPAAVFICAIFGHRQPEQVQYADAESVGDAVEDIDGGVGQASFDKTHVGPMHPHRAAEAVLGNDLADAAEQQGEGSRAGKPAGCPTN